MVAVVVVETGLVCKCVAVWLPVCITLYLIAKHCRYPECIDASVRAFATNAIRSLICAGVCWRCASGLFSNQKCIRFAYQRIRNSVESGFTSSTVRCESVSVSAMCSVQCARCT